MNSRPSSPALLRFLLTAILALGPVLIARADNPLQEIFSDEEYHRAGLDKLSPEEQAELLKTLHHLGVNAKLRASAEKFGKAEKPAANAEAASAQPAAPEKKSFWARVRDFGAEQLPIKNSKDEGEVVEVEAQMTEPFTGLRGGTLFHLDNGQVWQQRIPENYYIGTPIPNPKVTLRRTRFGYRLKIPAVSSGFDIAVKRVQ